jgi:hypothetical protein
MIFEKALSNLAPTDVRVSLLPSRTLHPAPSSPLTHSPKRYGVIICMAFVTSVLALILLLNWKKRQMPS